MRLPWRLIWLEIFQPHGLLALAAAGQQHHGARQRCAPGTALGQLGGVGHHVELEVAEHALHRRPQTAQALGIGLGLRPHRRQGGVGRARQPGHALGLVQGFIVQPGVGQHQRHTLRAAGSYQIGPDFGFHQDADGGPQVAQKPCHRAGRVPRLPDLHVTGLQQFFALGAARGGAVGEQQAHARQLLAQRAQQDGGSTRFAQRDGVYPNQRPSRRGVATHWHIAVVAKTLGHAQAVAGLGQGAAAQLAAQQWLGRPGQGRIQPQGKAR